MNFKPTVMKFGGSSLEDAQAFERVSRIVREGRRAGATVVVASAMRGVTDALLGSARLAEEAGAAAAVRALAPHFERHADVARTLLSPPSLAAAAARIEAARADTGRLLRSLAAPCAPLLDELVAHGELLSTALLAAVLREHGLPAREVDARRCIITDDAHGCAAPIHDATERRTRAELTPVLDASAIPVLGGFIASTAKGATTTLGRNGSDYTAALVGAALSAAAIQIWTDVAGVLTADPRLVPDARTVRHLSYAEAAALAHFGAKVLCPKAIQPLAGQGIPLLICNSFTRGGEATVVSASAQASRRAVKAISHKECAAVVHIVPAYGGEAHQLMGPLLDLLEDGGGDVVPMAGAGVPPTPGDAGGSSRVSAEPQRIGPVRVEEDRAIICVVGEGLRHAPVAAQVCEVLSDMEVRFVAQGASRVSMLFVVAAARIGEAVARLHESFFAEDGSGKGDHLTTLATERNPNPAFSGLLQHE
jgi:aspartate kinase